MATSDLRPSDNHTLIVLRGFPIILDIERCLSPEIADNNTDNLISASRFIIDVSARSFEKQGVSVRQVVAL